MDQHGDISGSASKYTRNRDETPPSCGLNNIAGFYSIAAYNARLAALKAVSSSSFSDPLRPLMDAPSFTG
jgi:hypothetical protein